MVLKKVCMLAWVVSSLKEVLRLSWVGKLCLHVMKEGREKAFYMKGDWPRAAKQIFGKKGC